MTFLGGFKVKKNYPCWPPAPSKSVWAWCWVPRTPRLSRGSVLHPKHLSQRCTSPFPFVLPWPVWFPKVFFSRVCLSLKETPLWPPFRQSVQHGFLTFFLSEFFCTWRVGHPQRDLKLAQFAGGAAPPGIVKPRIWNHHCKALQCCSRTRTWLGPAALCAAQANFRGFAEDAQTDHTMPYSIYIPYSAKKGFQVSRKFSWFFL